MEETIRMADGTEVPGAYAVSGSGRLYVYIQGRTMMEVCALLSDEEKTREITYRGMVWEGYTELTVLQKTATQIGAGLARKEA